MNLPIHCFSTWVIIYISSWMKYKVQQNMNTINLYLVSIAAIRTGYAVLLTFRLYSIGSGPKNLL